MIIIEQLKIYSDIIALLNRCLFETEFSMAHYIDRYVDSIQKLS